MDGTQNRHDQKHADHQWDAHRHGDVHASVPGSGSLAKDPVCGMDVDPTAGGPQAEQAAFLERETTADAIVSGSAGDVHVEYTCPMHPQIRQLGPGSCPICGMS